MSDIRQVHAVLEEWNARRPHPRLKSRSEVVAGHTVLVLAIALLAVGNALAAGIALGVWILFMGSPLLPVVPTVRLLAYARAEAERRAAR